jgi:CPA1 family monovalent cation:H+ antiporter
MGIEQIVERLLFLVCFSILGLLIGRLLRTDNSIGCLLSGAIAGALLPTLGFDTGVRAHNLKDLVFLVILPVLIFEAAWHLKPKLLKRWLLPILILAVPGVLLSTALTAALLYFGMDHPQGFPWPAALLAGTILAATDPAAVTARLRQLDAPEGLTTIVEGESLFNDASAVLLFGVILLFAIGENPAQNSSLALEFATVFIGGSLLGVLFGLITAIAILALASIPGSSVVLLFSALASFFVAEEIIGVSGIMAVTFAALSTRQLLHEQRHQLMTGATDSLEWLSLLLQAILFTLMGLVITWSMFEQMWLAMLLAIMVSLVARFANVYSCNTLSGLLGRSIDRRWSLLMSWGGLRGAIAIALVLALPESLPYWWTIQSMVFAVVIFSLLVQGTSIGQLLNKLKLRH